MTLRENDAASLLASELTAEGSGGGGGALDLSEQLTADTNQTPPVYIPLAAATDDIPPVVMTAATPAVAPVSVANSSLSSFAKSLKSALGSAQSAVVSPVQSGLNSAAKAAGASDQAATSIASWAGPVLVAVVLAIAGTMYAFRRRIFSHHVTA